MIKSPVFVYTICLFFLHTFSCFLEPNVFYKISCFCVQNLCSKRTFYLIVFIKNKLLFNISLYSEYVFMKKYFVHSFCVQVSLEYFTANQTQREVGRASVCNIESLCSLLSVIITSYYHYDSLSMVQDRWIHITTNQPRKG